jgi:hypothetical protein
MPNDLVELADTLLKTLGEFQQSIKDGKSSVTPEFRGRLDGDIRKLCAAVKSGDSPESNMSPRSSLSS